MIGGNTTEHIREILPRAIGEVTRKNVKRKGNRGELELLHLLEARGLPAVRNDQTYVGGRENPDISMPGLHIEVKRVEALRITEALNQAISDAAGRALPVVMHRRNRGEWVAFMRLDGFLALYGPFLQRYIEERDRELDAEYKRIKAMEGN